MWLLDSVRGSAAASVSIEEECGYVSSERVGVLWNVDFDLLFVNEMRLRLAFLIAGGKQTSRLSCWPDEIWLKRKPQALLLSLKDFFNKTKNEADDKFDFEVNSTRLASWQAS